jgi:uncharacterized damage-inducible protein DinB
VTDSADVERMNADEIRKTIQRMNEQTAPPAKSTKPAPAPRAATPTNGSTPEVTAFHRESIYCNLNWEVRPMPETQPSVRSSSPEPWLRGTLTDLPPVIRAVLHALHLADEDLARWCGSLSDAKLNARPASIAPVAFHIRHIARSLDRLLTYAEGKQLEENQIAALNSELNAGASSAELFSELRAALRKSEDRIRAFLPEQFDDERTAGKKRLRTTVAGLLIHCAEHTQRHVGQAITTAKIVSPK